MNAAEAISFLRSRLVLQRAATLLTVWSNCLAGWWLGGGDHFDGLPLLFAGAGLLYLGGTFWSDAFAINAGEENGRGPSRSPGATPLSVKQGWGLGLLAVGVVCLFWLGNVAGWLGMALTVLVIIAQVLRRLASFATVLPPVCRLFLYLIGASAGVIGVAGGPIWCGLALAIYILGAHYFARQKNAGPERHWPILLLAVPICLALIVDDDGARAAGLLLSAVLALWTARCLRPALWSEERDFAGALAGLVAGIVLVDLLAVADAPKRISAVFIGMFLATRALQTLGSRQVIR